MYLYTTACVAFQLCREVEVEVRRLPTLRAVAGQRSKLVKQLLTDKYLQAHTFQNLFTHTTECNFKCRQGSGQLAIGQYSTNNAYAYVCGTLCETSRVEERTTLCKDGILFLLVGESTIT